MKRNKLIGNIMICLGAILLIVMTLYLDFIISLGDEAHIISLLIYMIITFGISIPFILVGIIHRNERRKT